MPKSFAYYRLPYAETYTMVSSEKEALVLPSLADVDTVSGFLIAPFIVAKDTPIVLIQSDVVVEKHFDAIATPDTIAKDANDEMSETYARRFHEFHQAVEDGKFSKLVLSHCFERFYQGELAAQELFLKACNAYPRLMIQIFSTPQTGTWLIASPEPILEGVEGKFHTVALAGTMPWKTGYLDWTEKNKNEQQIVEQTIEAILSPYCQRLLKDGPVSMRAGDLAHLRTDFRFTLSPSTSVGTLLSCLHPTPAVCGFPQRDALLFIQQHENVARRYYTGFAGPVNINTQTHLFVSLRCAEFKDRKICAYAGGGIMPESTCASEWKEVVAKAQTILSLL